MAKESDSQRRQRPRRDPELEAAHKFSTYNRASIEKRAACGCFNCQSAFQSLGADNRPDWPIVHWTDKEQTAMCPFCNVDAVISTADLPLATNAEFLAKMHAYCFGIVNHGQGTR